MSARFAFPFAVLSAAGLVLLTLVGGAFFPDYSHTSQFISELGATAAPHEVLVRFGGFLPVGVFLCLFAVAAFNGLPRSSLSTLGLLGLVLYAGGYLAAVVFPCDAGCRPEEPSLSQLIHNLFGLTGYLAAPWFMAALGTSARRWPGGTHLVGLGFMAAGLSLVGLASLSPSSPWVGLSQRLIETSVMSWVVVCGAYLRSQARRTA